MMSDNPGPPSGDAADVKVKTCDASGMLVIHRFLRSGYGEGRGLVRGVREDDLTHAGVVADHLGLLSVALHSHHEGEDARLWPALGDRAPGCALHVERMKAQHREILSRVDDLEAVVPKWRATASAADAAAVVSALDEVNDALAIHLPDEETNIVPVMEYTITEAEIEWFAEHGRKATPRGALWISLGMILSAQPDGGEQFLREGLPGPVRLLWRWVGKRKYARYRATLTGA